MVNVCGVVILGGIKRLVMLVIVITEECSQYAKNVKTPSVNMNFMVIVGN